ncbi:hypothetical protein [Synechococcus sp. PCC 7336]|nr:hypothetical protein [Synechococcus sp. PCC 7336]
MWRRSPFVKGGATDRNFADRGFIDGEVLRAIETDEATSTTWVNQ